MIELIKIGFTVRGDILIAVDARILVRNVLLD